MSQTSRIGVLLLAAAGTLAACAAPTPTSESIGGESILPAQQFQAYYEAHSGPATFGPAIEPPRQEAHLVRQTFLNVELVFDPSAPSSAQVGLAPLGRSLGLAEPPVPPPSDPEARYFDSTGHTLYTGFVQPYSQLGGERVAGPPISEVAFGDGRVMQVFENLALYREANAAPSEVHLMALGLASRPERGRDYRYPMPPDLRSRPFGLFLDQFGGEPVFGRPLSEPRAAADGSLEQVYERAVLYAPADAPGAVRLRPLGAKLAPAEPPVAESGDTVGLYIPQTGHYVLWAFASFYRSHGAEKVLGLPLEEARPVNSVLTQRFENVILEYHYDLPPHLAVQLAPLGLEQAGAASAPTATAAAPFPTSPASQGCSGPAAIATHVESPLLPPGGTQRVRIQVTRSDGTPWAGVTPLAVVHAPAGDVYPTLVPTDLDGKTEFSLSLADLKPGEIVNVEVVVASGACSGYAIDQFAGGLAPPAP